MRGASLEPEPPENPALPLPRPDGAGKGWNNGALGRSRRCVHGSEHSEASNHVRRQSPQRRHELRIGRRRRDRDPGPPQSEHRRHRSGGHVAVRRRAPRSRSAVALPLLWGNAVSLHDLVLAAVFYLVAGFGISVGFHRLFTHRSFTANRPLKFILAAAGSMAFEGSVTSWVANHRRHHMFSDQPGDPHSPHRYGTGTVGPARRASRTRTSAGCSPRTSRRRHASRRTCCATTTSSPRRACSRCSPHCRSRSRSASAGRSPARSPARSPRCIWAGVRAHGAVPPRDVEHQLDLPHVRDASRSRPRTAARTSRRSRLLSLGESWHSYHHANPSSARHGVLPRQVDLSARLIRLLEQAGWATPGALARAGEPDRDRRLV